MHELSIAESLLEVVRQHVPAGAAVRRVRIRAGPMQAVEPQAMALAWTAATQDTELAGSAIDVEAPPWTLECPDCGRRFPSPEVFADCSCGGQSARPVDGAELTLLSLDVEELAPPPRADKLRQP